jgi:preprotein translocase subunit SecB
VSDFNEDLIRLATQSLQLRNILLWSSKFERPARLSNADVQGVQQHKRAAAYTVSEEVEQGKTQKVLHVTVELGTRVIAPGEADEPAVFYVIEATFLVSYEFKTEVDEQALRVFADFNAVHNVWPFWRQHVFDVVQKGGLPKLKVPLFPGIKNVKKTAKAQHQAG